MKLRDIGTLQCKPYLLITQEGNGSRPLSKEITGTSSIGNTLTIETTGNYELAIAAITDKQLIQRVNSPKQAYIEHTSFPSRPKYRDIGEVQAAEPYSNDFHFDEKMVQCKLYHRTIECQKTVSKLFGRSNQK